ncbi:transmembrane protein, putative [Medicago truncatula]|uniref:Transmembrane protein, putative n=1 Tax=Medicago truncatula TaxID=3880 RepID=A0A072TJ46_MEDTR|nr:transmembrane protein, putative [Medicago truncatula]
MKIYLAKVWQTETLGSQVSHPMTPQVILEILTILHFFILFCSFVHVTLLALFLNP